MANLTKLTFWLTRPLSEIESDPTAFLAGPIRGLMADVAKAVAPAISDQIKEQIIAVKERAAMQGYQDGLQGRDGSAGKDELYAAAYQLAQQGGKPSKVKALVREAVEASPDDWGGPLVRKTLMAVWDAAEPSQLWNRIHENAGQKGWRIGIAYSLYDVLVEVLAPSALLKIASNPKFIDLNALNLGPLVYAAVRTTVDALPAEIEIVVPGGQVDWYQEQYGAI